MVSTVRDYEDPTQKRPSIVNGRRVQSKRRVFEVRVSGMENVTAFAESVPMWGPRGIALIQAIPKLMRGGGVDRRQHIWPRRWPMLC